METDQILYEKNPDLFDSAGIDEQIDDGLYGSRTAKRRSSPSHDTPLPRLAKRKQEKKVARRCLSKSASERVSTIFFEALSSFPVTTPVSLLPKGWLVAKRPCSSDMTEKGREIGLTGSTFKNASGWVASRTSNDGARPRNPCAAHHRGLSRVLLHLLRSKRSNIAGSDSPTGICYSAVCGCRRA